MRDNHNSNSKKVISEKCEITVNQKIKDTDGTYLIRLKNRFVASCFKPGQFVMLKANSTSLTPLNPLLSRPFSIFNKFSDEEFEILYRVYGKATDLLSSLRRGDSVNVVGPLGNGFNIDNKEKSENIAGIHILIAGGIGIAPLYSIPYRLNSLKNSEEDGKIILYYGARAAEELYFKYSIHAGFDEVYFATDDGSFGRRGNIIDLLKENLGDYMDGIGKGANISFYSCGPKPMLKALVSTFKEFSLSNFLQVSLEESFGCGIGVCLGCVVKCKNENSNFVGNDSSGQGNFVYKRICKDGPVFFADELYDYGKKIDSVPLSVKDNNISYHENRPSKPGSGQTHVPEEKINLSVKLGKLRLDYPVMPASGTFGYAEEFAEITDYEHFGALVSKGISLKPSKGNDMPRITETSCGMINSIGLQNVGIDSFLTEKLPFMRSFKKPVIVNFFGSAIEDYVLLAERLAAAAGGGITALEANISCPNIKEGGRSFGSDPEIVYELVSSVKEVIGDKLPLIVKLPPMVPDIGLIAEVCEKAGADIISLINTIPSAQIDIKTKKYKLSRGFGGLSGPAIKPVAIKLISDVYNSVRIPVIGMGGIASWEDAIEFFLAGASAVAVGTYSFINPKIIPEITEGIKAYLTDNGFSDINEIIGLASRNR